MSDLQTNEEFDELAAFERWLTLVAEGTPPLNAGVELGWTPQKINKLIADPDVQEMLSYAHARADGSVVKAMHTQAMKGNMTAIQTWLFNRRPEDWRDIRKVVISGDVKVTPALITAAKQAARELLANADIKVLQQLVEATATDADRDE